jgi:iron complex outermembrane recepter protein
MLSAPDPTGEPIFYQTGPSNTKGVEAESNVLIGHGFSLYLNGTLGSARYAQTGLYVASAPKNTETLGLTYRVKGWDLGFFNKRIGAMYNDNGSTNQAVAIDPFNVSNLFLNYTVRGDSYLRGTKIRLGVNNLLDQHSIVGVNPALASSVASPNDVLTLLPARSVSLTVTFGYAPAR